jgi:hypothetical protein
MWEFEINERLMIWILKKLLMNQNHTLGVEEDLKVQLSL